MSKKETDALAEHSRGTAAIWGIAVMTAALAFLVMRSVRLYGDDYFYGTFMQNGWSGFWEANCDHYLHSNGRVMVHALDAVFLSLPPIVWQILNSIMLGSIVFLGMRIIFPTKNQGGFFAGFCGSAILCAMILYMDVRLSNQSVYWQTGSWNYVFPFVLLLLTWWMLARRSAGKGNPVVLSLLALLSAATTEQNAMMTIGICVLYLMDHCLIRREKIDLAVVWALVFAVLGAVLVLAAPSQWTRLADEQTKLSAMSTFEMIKVNAKEQIPVFFLEKYMCPYQLMMLGGTIIFAFAVSKRLPVGWNIFFKAFSVCGFLVIGIVLRFSGAEDVEVNELLLWSGIIGFYEIVAFILELWYLLLRRPKGYIIPLAALILAAGSQAMMLVSPIFGPRTTLCAVFLMGIYTAYMAVRFLPFEKGKHETKVLLMLLSLILMGHGILTFQVTEIGYRQNAPVDDKNRMLIMEYDQQGGDELVQYKMRLEPFGWSYPYISDYHQNWYKRYYKLPNELTIRWEEMQ